MGCKALKDIRRRTNPYSSVIRVRIVKWVMRMLGVWFECPECGWEQSEDDKAQREGARHNAIR